jgi:hypothetical protein
MPSVARQARTGGAIAGALLLALPALDVLLGAASPGLVHFAVASFGAALIAVSRKLR